MLLASALLAAAATYVGGLTIHAAVSANDATLPLVEAADTRRRKRNGAHKGLLSITWLDA